MTRHWMLCLMAGGVAAGCASAVITAPTVLLWNATASAPIGLYLVRPASQLHVGELVAVRPPARWEAWLDRRGYLPRGVPLVKTVSALSGQLACRHGADVTVDGRYLVRARKRDRRARPLPVWSGCHRLGEGDAFLINAPARDSFDGRYFGLSRRDDIVGQLEPVWIRGG